LAGVGISLGAIGIAVGLAWIARRDDEVARCGPGFTARGPRCLADDTHCPSPLVAAGYGCDAPDLRIAIPAAAVTLGPSDWEAEGRVLPRTIRVGAFLIDGFEVTRGHWERGQGVSQADVPRAASGMTRSEAASYCASRGGRLPSEDEWIVAAASAADPPRRYPWGDTGAVCRRAAWGLLAGPCARDAEGPDTVGAHPDGDSPLGLHDLAGNVAEWVDGARGRSTGVAKGGSWQTGLAAELRIWARLELAPDSRDSRVGVRCAYDP
jgi:formylglycine-generating enzyme required for sulfatase activity